MNARSSIEFPIMNTGLILPFCNSVLLVGITTSFPQSIALEHCLISLPEEEEVEERKRRENGRRGKGRIRNMEILFNKAIVPSERGVSTINVIIQSTHNIQVTDAEMLQKKKKKIYLL